MAADATRSSRSRAGAPPSPRRPVCPDRCRCTGRLELTDAGRGPGDHDLLVGRTPRTVTEPALRPRSRPRGLLCAGRPAGPEPRLRIRRPPPADQRPPTAASDHAGLHRSSRLHAPPRRARPRPAGRAGRGGRVALPLQRPRRLLSRLRRMPTALARHRAVDRPPGRLLVRPVRDPGSAARRPHRRRRGVGRCAATGGRSGRPTVLNRVGRLRWTPRSGRPASSAMGDPGAGSRAGPRRRGEAFEPSAIRPAGSAVSRRRRDTPTRARPHSGPAGSP